MRVKILKYIQLPYRGELKVCDPNTLLDLPDDQAIGLIEIGNAIEIGATDNVAPVSIGQDIFENKMVRLTYKTKNNSKRRRPNIKEA
jgi:hypothetical protein